MYMSFNDISNAKPKVHVRFATTVDKFGYGTWDYSNLDFQFRRCGTLASTMTDPYAPIIQRKHTHITSGLKHVFDTHVIINRLRKLCGDTLDDPIHTIQIINRQLLSDRTRAMYYKALFQSVPRMYSDTQTLGDVYSKYYTYSTTKSAFVKKCCGSKTPSIELYELEYNKYSRSDSLTKL